MKAYPNLKFIGLALTNANSFDMFLKDPSTISNNHTHSNVNSSPTLHISASSPALTSLINESQALSQRSNQLLVKLQTNSSARKLTDLIVTGESTESQLISSLRHYKTRHIYVQKALYHLFMLTKNYQTTRVDLIQIVIDLMQIHSKSQSVQLAATTCIFNLTRQNLFMNLSANVLTQIINTILATMLNYPNTLIVTALSYFIYY